MAFVPNAQEIVALGAFRNALLGFELTPAQLTDTFLLRWLRSKNLNIEKSKEMLQKHLAYNKEHDIANILNWEPPTSFKAEYFYEITGRAATGAPVIIIHLGSWDFRKAIETGQKENLLKYIDYMLAEVQAKMTEVGADQALAIDDYAGFAMRQMASLPAVHLLVEFSKRTEENHPFIFSDVFILNTSKVFQMAHRFMKPVLSKATRDVLNIHSSNKSEWIPELLKRIPADQLPIEYGGTIAREKPMYVPDPNEFIIVTVKRGEKYETTFQVDEPGTILRWRFKVELHDIGFLILLDDKDKIRDDGKVDAANLEQDGEIRCEKAGKYSFVFDNGHSKFRGKTVHYRINMLTPDVQGQVEVVEEAIALE